MRDQSQNEESSSIWPITDWSSLGRAAEVIGHDAERLGRLIQKYEAPLRVYFAATFPNLKERADEFLQDFAQDRFLREGWLAKASPQRGRFRNFLKTSLRNFVFDRLSREARQPTSLDGLDLEPLAQEKASEAFDLCWVRTVLDETLARMKADCISAKQEQPRRAKIWAVFQLRIIEPEFEGKPAPGYGEIVERVGIVSPTDAQNMLATAKRIFIRHLMAVIAEYEFGGQATRIEIADIKGFLRKLSERKST